jgi:hypothetical protein
VSVDSATLRRLAALNLAPDQMAGVLDILAGIAEVEEKRKQGQRDRTAKHRAKRDGNVTKTSPERDIPSPTPSSSPSSNEEGKKKTNGRTRTRETVLEPDWRPDEKGMAYAAEHGLSPAETEREIERIRNWSIGKGRTARDWSASWRNWILGVVEKKPTGPPPSPQLPFGNGSQQRGTGNGTGRQQDRPFTRGGGGQAAYYDALSARLHSQEADDPDEWRGPVVDLRAVERG